MGLIKAPRRRIRANFIPDFPVEANFVSDLSISELYLPGWGRTLVRNTQTVMASGTSVIPGQVGRTLSLTAGSFDPLTLGSNADNLLALDQCTVFIWRRSKDTTARDSIAFGYSASSSVRVLAHMPYSDGKLYWDFGDATEGSGRLSIAFAKSTLPEKLVLVAGGGKGREIWRNGIKIASNASTTSRSSYTGAFVIGGITGATTGSDSEEVFMFGVSRRAWTDAEIIAWSIKPTRVLKPANDAIWIPVSTGTAGTTYNVSIAETASAVDTLSAILAGLASIAETGAALDTSSAALIGTASVAETGAATDAQSGSTVLTATRSDALTAADTTSTGGAITSAAVAETAVATDSTSAIATFLASVAESGAAVASQSATAVLNAAWSDALNAADSQNWGGSVISVSLSEALNALDSQSASAVFAASVTESSAALDSTSCVLIANASISEVLAALDSSSVQLITSASIAEALSALDTTSVVNLNFIAAKEHILTGRERSTVLVGRERVTVLVGKERILVIY